MTFMATSFEPWSALLGGGLIGLSAVVLMASHGKIAGLSGIFGGLLKTRQDAEFRWRALFIVGLLAGALLASRAGAFDPASLGFSGGWLVTAVGGLLVGAGTALGSGCTSGHGICGLARLSPRSIAATFTFMAVAIATVFVTRHMIGG
ncbi:MAG: YeeE/YedE family protein [Alphaproteobacteria bacterium]|nr:YeeE/YedE family protein [Alphaproteobacteria bacterium]